MFCSFGRGVLSANIFVGALGHRPQTAMRSSAENPVDLLGSKIVHTLLTLPAVSEKRVIVTDNLSGDWCPIYYVSWVIVPSEKLSSRSPKHLVEMGVQRSVFLLRRSYDGIYAL